MSARKGVQIVRGEENVARLAYIEGRTIFLRFSRRLAPTRHMLSRRSVNCIF